MDDDDGTPALAATTADSPPAAAGRPGGATATRARTHRGAEEWSQ